MHVLNSLVDSYFMFTLLDGIGVEMYNNNNLRSIVKDWTNKIFFELKLFWKKVLKRTRRMQIDVYFSFVSCQPTVNENVSSLINYCELNRLNHFAYQNFSFIKLSFLKQCFRKYIMKYIIWWNRLTFNLLLWY